MKNSELKKISPKKSINRFLPITRVGAKEVQKVNIVKTNEILSEYQTQFKAKQQIKEFYGNLSEGSFNLIKTTNNKNKINYLEKRLDVVLFRLGFARSILEARNLIKGGLVRINNNLISKKAYNKILSIGSKISVLNTGIVYLSKIKQLKFNYPFGPIPTHLLIPSLKDQNLGQLDGYLIKEPIESEIYLPYKFPINKI